MNTRFDKVLPDYSLRKLQMLPGMPPCLQFNFTFSLPVCALARATLLQHNWESRTRFTTVESVQQLDEDRVVFYRRKAISTTPVEHWEQVVIDRANKTITVSTVGPNRDGSMYTSEKSTFTPSECGEKTHMQQNLWDVDGNGAAKVDAFKTNVARVLKAVQFDKWASEEKSE